VATRLHEYRIKTLPLAAAFELSCDWPTAGNYRQARIAAAASAYARQVRGVRGERGSFGVTEPGEYSGTLVLRPDPNYAYEDPAIKSLWNGTLEFPISFVVYVRTQTE
jgi:hypothetical protein